MYRVTISREKSQWIARDDDGITRSWCKATFAKTASGAALAMFHGDELSNVEQIGRKAIAWITEE